MSMRFLGGPPEHDPAFTELFDSAYPRAVRLGQRLLGTRAAGEDLAAEAFARAYARWGSVRRHPAPDAWVLRTATNLAIDQLRRSAPVSAEAPVADPADAVALRLALASALASLSRQQRTVVTLRYLADLPEHDVAIALGISVGSVKTHLSRGLDRLRRDAGPGGLGVGGLGVGGLGVGGLGVGGLAVDTATPGTPLSAPNPGPQNPGRPNASSPTASSPTASSPTASSATSTSAASNVRLPKA